MASALPKMGWGVVGAVFWGEAGRDPAAVVGLDLAVVLVEGLVAEVLAGEQAELPEVVGDVLADVGDGAVGADDDLGVFVGEAGVGDGYPSSDVPARRMTQQPLFLPMVSR